MVEKYFKSIKEIPREEFFGPGNRACPGCMNTLAVRLVTKAVGQNSIVITPTGCLEITSSCYPFTSWAVPWYHVAFENAGAVASGVEAALKVLMRKGRLKKENIHVLAIAGDGGTADIGLQALSGALERGHDLLYVCLDNEAYMNCLSTSSLIMTEDGLKKITEVKKGDKIYAFDTKTHQPVLKRCTGVFDNGGREIFEVKTLHHTLRATPNHPFLVLKRNGRGRRNELVWKTLCELKPGDEVVVVKNLNGRKFFEFKFRPVQRGGKVTHLSEVNLPKHSSPSLMKFLGIWVGDGWVRPKKGEVGFALPKGVEKKTLIELSCALFGSDVSVDEMYVYMYSVNLARFINSLGFGSGAKNKTIPAFVFTLPKREKEAFVEGLMLSDGYETGGSLRYVSASYELLRRLRLLLQTMGYRVGKIHRQERKKGMRCVRRNLLKDTAYGYICFSRRKEPNASKYPSQSKYRNFLVESDHFEMEKIKEIELVGREPTLDLRVEGEHNFLADGIVVHNTGIQRSSSTPMYAWTTTSAVGKAIPGKIQPKKNLVAIALAHKIPYVATACTSYPLDLINKAKKGAEVEGPAYLHIFVPCPIGWRFPSNLSIKIGRLGVQTGVFPIYEVENGKVKLTVEVPKRKPVSEYLKLQGRFAHLTEKMINEIQEYVDRESEKLGLGPRVEV